MTPYLEDSDVRLYQGDSLEVLRSLTRARLSQLSLLSELA